MQDVVTVSLALIILTNAQLKLHALWGRSPALIILASGINTSVFSLQRTLHQNYPFVVKI
jgi:hypothetical protein